MSIKQEVLKYLKENKERFKKEYGIKEIYLFGSVARGEDNEKSDIDLLVEFDHSKPMTLRRFFGIIEEMENRFNKKIDLAESLKNIAYKSAKKDFINVF
jgi:predicted nucleotidyltransferase